MRPILITSLTLMAGAWAIIDDPIFQGMAVSLLFGAGVATLMAVIVIPIGCISLRREFYLMETPSGERALSARFAEIEGVVPPEASEPAAPRPRTASGPPLWLRLWSVLIALLFATIEGVGALIRWAKARRAGRLEGPAVEVVETARPDPVPDPPAADTVVDQPSRPKPRSTAPRRSSAAAAKPTRSKAKTTTTPVADDPAPVKTPRTRRAPKKDSNGSNDPKES
jgi:hypothetical protein